MNNWRWMRVGALIATLLLGAGCAGANANMRVTFNQARFPVSMSQEVPGPDGVALHKRDLNVVGSFEASQRGFALLYGLLPLGTVNFSQDLNEQVSNADGEAVVDLQVEVMDSDWNWLWPLIWVPVFPANVQVRVWGDIVKRKDGETKQ